MVKKSPDWSLVKGIEENVDHFAAKVVSNTAAGKEIDNKGKWLLHHNNYILFLFNVYFLPIVWRQLHACL